MAELSNLFQKYRKIAIYGLGNETERVLGELGTGVKVVGLLDGYKEAGELYGVPIIPIEKAIQEGVQLILVAARPGSCKAIAQRIGKICMEHRIELRDVRGKDLCNPQKVTYDFKGINGITREQLWQAIDKNEVISVDLFDTLIMRQVLFVTDVFEIVDRRLREKGVKIADFCGRRLESEKHLAKKKQATLEEIYAYMIAEYQIQGVQATQLAKLEWSVDRELLIPRREVCKLMEEAQSQGKKIYIVSDSYYTKKQLIEILNKYNITFYTEIFASCEYGTGKTQNLFQIVREKLERESWLHIGDDLVADVEGARRNQLEICQVYSAADLLEMAGYLGVWNSADTVWNRIKIGMFIAELFNSPFQFEDKERKISVRQSYDLGYLFFAPMITDFVLWFEEQIEKYKIKNIWFGARDGYLIKKLYDSLEENRESTYLLTSRTAAIRAGMEDEEDIRYVAEMKFSGSVREQLRERFGIQIIEAAGADPVEDVLQYTGAILENAQIKRENYKKYIQTLKIKDEKEQIAFFDFVAKGTTQMYLSRLVPNHIKGFYFLRLEEEQMSDKQLDIVPFYSDQEKESSAIFDDYYILETMLTAPEPSILEFDENGGAIYAKETRKQQDIRCFMEAQRGIVDYFQTYLRLCPREIRVGDKIIDEAFLRLIHGVEILDPQFLELNVEDPFFNRMTKITDVI